MYFWKHKLDSVYNKKKTLKINYIVIDIPPMVFTFSFLILLINVVI